MTNAKTITNQKPDENLTLSVYKSIRKMMLNYEIVPGQRLVFVDLAKQLGVSRTPVNIALSILAKEGFFDFVPNQGYTVHKITREEAEGLYELIKILALGAIPKAIRDLTPEKLREFERRILEYEKAVAEQVSRGRFILDQELHAYLLEMSGNLYLADHFREAYQRIFLRHRIESLRPHRAQQVVQEHKEIFEAVQKRDVELTKKLFESHIEAGKNYIFSYIFDEAEGR